MITQTTPLEIHIIQFMVSDFKPRKFEGASLNTFLVIAIWNGSSENAAQKYCVKVLAPPPP